MDRDDKQRAFLKRSEEAERQAARVPNSEAADKWRRIAAGYRDLAELAKRELL